MQAEVLPEYVEWLFGTAMRDYTLEQDRAIIFELISQFMNLYLNMEIFSKKPAIFRSRLQYYLKKYRHLLMQGGDEYNDLFNASVNLTRTELHTHTFEEAGKRDSSHSNTATTSNETQGTSSGTQEGSSTTSSSGTQTQSGTTDTTGHDEGSTSNTQDSSSTTDVHSSGSTSGSGRQVNSDYPQTAVTLSLTPPTAEQGTWPYASTGGDSVSQGSNSQDTLTEANGVNTSSGTSKNDNSSKVVNEGNVATEGSGSTTQTSKTSGTSGSTSEGSASDEGTTTGSDSRTGSSSDEVNADWDTISQFDRIKMLLDYLREHPYSPIYKVLTHMEDLFIGIYTDESRWGYIDPETDLTKYLIGGH